MAELLFTSITQFITALVLILQLPTPRSTCRHLPHRSCILFGRVLCHPANSNNPTNIYLSIYSYISLLLSSLFSLSLSHMWWFKLSPCILAGCWYLSHQPWHFSKGLRWLRGTDSLCDLSDQDFSQWQILPSRLGDGKLPENVSCSLSAPIASSDHMPMRVNISLAIRRELPHSRRVWQFTQANSQGLQKQPSLFRTALTNCESRLSYYSLQG